MNFPRNTFFETSRFVGSTIKLPYIFQFQDVKHVVGLSKKNLNFDAKIRAGLGGQEL